MSTLQEDLRRAKEMLASSQRGAQAGSAGGRRPMLSEAQKMRELVAEANAVVEERDRLMEEVERWRLMEERRHVAREQGRPEDEAEPVEGLELTEETRQDLEAAMYAMRLERDHAQAQAARLKAQLEDLFGEQVLAPAAAAGVRKAPGKKGGAPARESELEVRPGCRGACRFEFLARRTGHSKSPPPPLFLCFRTLARRRRSTRCRGHSIGRRGKPS